MSIAEPGARVADISRPVLGRSAPVGPGGRRFRLGRQRAMQLAPIALCVPYFAFFALFVVVPVIYAIVLSTEGVHRSGLGLAPPTTSFVGVHNYATALSDGSLGSGLIRVLEYFVIQSPIMLAIAIVIALLLDRQSSKVSRAIVRTVCFLPFSMPLVVGSVMWSFLYEPDLSPIVRAVRDVGAGSFAPLGPHLIFWGLTNILTWEWTGYNVIIIVTALQGVPTEALEAARLDGASEWTVATRVKLPMLRPAIVMAGLFSMIGVLQMFGEPETLSAITSAISSNYTPNMYIFSTAFNSNNLNYASAIAVLLALLTGALSIVALRATRRFATI